ncbi:hypothetical protein, partial [Oharaeibacter diazotrophicus]
ATIPACIDRATVDALVGHYRAAVARGAAPVTSTIDRNAMHDDPAGRVVLRALLPAIEAIAGVPLKPSYSYASLYRPGASMPMHRDRAQCAYTLALAIDHRPTPADGVSPWPLTVDPGDGTPPVDHLLPIGGGVMFRGTRLLHGRGPLAPGETCWTLLLHYVDRDFDGPLG